MRTWSKTAGLLFMAAMSVYSDSATPGTSATSVSAAIGGTPAPAKPVGELPAVALPAPAAAPALDPNAVSVAPQVTVVEDAAQPTATPAAPAHVAVEGAPAAPAPAPAAEGTPATPAAAPASENATAAEPATQPVAVEPAPRTQGKSVSKDEVQVSDAGTVEIHVNEANLVEVLRMLSIQSQRNIIASKDVQGTVTANLYDVTVREALDSILKANGYGYREKGNFIYVYTAKEIADMEKAERHVSSEVFRLYYTPAANAQNMLKPLLSEAGAVAFTQPAASGISTGVGDVGGNSHADEDCIVVTDYPENLDKVRALLKEIDRRPQQILIEATILRAALSNDNTLGVDFNFLGGVDFHTITESNGQFLSASPVSSGGATGGGTGSGSGTGGSGSGPGSGSGGGAANGTGLNAWTPTASAVGTGSNFTQGANGFRVGVVGSDFSLFLNALESHTNTTVLANPKILALNKQRGEVIVGRKDGYYTTTVTENATVQTVEFLETGTRLVFRPYVGDDGFVRMEVHPEDSSGGLNAANLPFKVTTEVTSNVMVKDGHTIVIGGLFREVNTANSQQVPFLGSLPLAGYLFRKQADTSIREEIIILLTPHVIKDQAAYAANSERLMKDADKLRVGVRQGMMPFSRTRLAEISYDLAKEELQKPDGDRKKAQWYLNCATSLDPIFPEAVSLKESLSGEEITATDHSMTRDFLRREILAERATGATTRPNAYSVPLRGREEANKVTPALKTDTTASAAATTTQPTGAEAVAESPADDNSAEIAEATEAVPTTKPSVAVTTDEKTPAAEPAVNVTVMQLAADETAAPATRPTAAAPAAPATPAVTEPVAEATPAEEEEAEETSVETATAPAAPEIAAAPATPVTPATTQPSNTTVTELPADEVTK